VTDEQKIPCMFCGSTDSVKMRRVYGLQLWMVAACDLCVELVKAAGHSTRETWTLTAHGATHVMNRIEKLEGLTKAIDWNEMPIKGADRFDPEDGKDCDGELEDSPWLCHDVTTFATTEAHIVAEFEHQILHRPVLKQVREEWQEIHVMSLDLLRRDLWAIVRKVLDVRERALIQREDVLSKKIDHMMLEAVGKHSGWYAKVPEGER